MELAETAGLAGTAGLAEPIEFDAMVAGWVAGWPVVEHPPMPKTPASAAASTDATLGEIISYGQPRTFWLGLTYSG